MKLIFTTHLRKRMATRRISEADVRAVLSNFDDSMPGDQPTTIRYLGFVGMAPRALSVVVEKPGVAKDTVIVVTTYWE